MEQFSLTWWFRISCSISRFCKDTDRLCLILSFVHVRWNVCLDLSMISFNILRCSIQESISLAQMYYRKHSNNLWTVCVFQTLHSVIWECYWSFEASISPVLKLLLTLEFVRVCLKTNSFFTNLVCVHLAKMYMCPEDAHVRDCVYIHCWPKSCVPGNTFSYFR